MTFDSAWLRRSDLVALCIGFSGSQTPELSIPACFIPSFRREDTANPVDKIPQFREWSTIIPELDTADFLNLYTVFMRLTA